MTDSVAKAKVYLAYRAIESNLNFLQKEGEEVIISTMANGILGKSGKVIMDPYDDTLQYKKNEG